MASALPNIQFNKPIQYYEFLSCMGLVDSIYEAMANPDLSEVVMTVLHSMRKTVTIPIINKVRKDEGKSTAFRNAGNAAYSRGQYQEALFFYNSAMLHAPKDSRALKLAFSNRSALHHNIKAFSKCIKDIEICFKLGCPADILDKLNKRYESAKSFIWMERLAENSDRNSFSESFFNFHVTRNPQISSASTDVGVIVEKRIPRIVATTDVKVGVILAIEESFVSMTTPKNSMISCYHCQKMDLNLIPCHNCCYVLFCSEECRQICLKEYHNIECQIMETLEMISGSFMSVPRLAIKAVLKMQYLSKDWEEYIAESQILGLKRMKNSSMNQIFDVKQKFSLLSTKDEKHFVHGPKYNASFVCAVLMHSLDVGPDIFPHRLEEKEAAQRAFARIFMFLNLYCTATEVLPGVMVDQQERMEIHDISNFGWFPLIGKLQKTCTPNTVMVNLNKRLALIALKPIKRGEELTVTYLDPWHHLKVKSSRQYNMMGIHGVVCNCAICTGEYKLLAQAPLSDIQKKNLRKLNLDGMSERLNPQNAPECFKKLCKMLAFLNNVPFSEEYTDTYNLWRRCILYFQDVTCSNELIDYITE